jgi:hypothetical protein
MLHGLWVPNGTLLDAALAGGEAQLSAFLEARAHTDAAQALPEGIAVQLDPEFRDLLSDMLRRDPQQRASAPQLRKRPIVQRALAARPAAGGAAAAPGPPAVWEEPLASYLQAPREAPAVQQLPGAGAAQAARRPQQGGLLAAWQPPSTSRIRAALAGPAVHCATRAPRPPTACGMPLSRSVLQRNAALHRQRELEREAAAAFAAPPPPLRETYAAYAAQRATRAPHPPTQGVAVSSSALLLYTEQQREQQLLRQQAVAAAAFMPPPGAALQDYTAQHAPASMLQHQQLLQMQMLQVAQQQEQQAAAAAAAAAAFLHPPGMAMAADGLQPQQPWLAVGAGGPPGLQLGWGGVGQQPMNADGTAGSAPAAMMMGGLGSAQGTGGLGYPLYPDQQWAYVPTGMGLAQPQLDGLSAPSQVCAA